MNISEIIKNIVSQSKKLEKSTLPSQGFFYKDDLEMRIRKADIEDIIDYEHKYDKDNLYIVIELIKNIVRKNTILNNDYKFEDIKSVDIVYIFIEIVKLTMNKSIDVPFFNEETGKPDYVEFSSKTFNYFDFNKFESVIDRESNNIIIDGYRFSMPSIGIENCLTNFLVTKTKDKSPDKWNSYSYDFLFFSDNKNNLTFSEIENLIEIFNFDIDDNEKKKIKSIVSKFMNAVSYSIKIDGKVIDIKSKLDLETIWKG